MDRSSLAQHTIHSQNIVLSKDTLQIHCAKANGQDCLAV